MRITWIGHSCFKIESGGYSIVLDPYEDGSVEGLSPVREKADMVLCTHEHGDHNFRAGVEIVSSSATPMKVETLESFHDDVHGAKRGSNKIYIISDGKARVAHLGDLGCHPDDIESLKGLDVVMIPVGGFYTIDGKCAAKIIKEIKPRIAIPMHFRSPDNAFGFDVLSTVDDFLGEFDEFLRLDGSTIDTSAMDCAPIKVLTPRALITG